MLFDPPSAGGVAEVVHDLGRSLESAVAVVERHPYPGVAEAHNVGLSITRPRVVSGSSPVPQPGEPACPTLLKEQR